MDAHRLGQMLARPGMDTRIWISLAYARGESVVDPWHGVFVDVTLVPSGEQHTARVAFDYSGPGFGIYLGQIHKNDELLVEAPSGDSAEGYVVTRRLYSASDLPPQEAISDPTEVMLVVEKDRNLRLKVSGGGQVQVDSETKVIVNCPTVEMGRDNAGTLKVLDGSKSVTIYEALETFWNTVAKPIFDAHIHPTGVGPSGNTATPLPSMSTLAKSSKVTIPDG